VLAARVDDARAAASDADPDASDGDALLARDASELRLVKDAYEIRQMREAVDTTGRGFSDVIADMPAVLAHARGERVVEGVFNARARADGNTVGYDTIAASGPHACILHWTRNDGRVVPGDLILIDAGVELDSYYTADITRTLPVSGTFTDVQREVYEAVREAADAALAIVRPGIRFREVHAAAMQVIARTVAGWASPSPRRRRSRPTTSTTAATWCTARATTSASTCTTARRRAATCTSTGSWRPAWCSPSSRACTSSPTTSRCRSASAGSACGSRTTSS
jgi:methionine aminopeptidase